jgi:Family of unknown function (DUF5681)
MTTRFKPGQSGNPAGRSKTYVLTDILNAIGNEVDPKTGKTYFQVAAEAMLSKAFRGDVQGFREIADRVEGKPRQRLELSGPDRSQIPIGTGIEDLDSRIEELLRRGRISRRGRAACGGQIIREDANLTHLSGRTLSVRETL